MWQLLPPLLEGVSNKKSHKQVFQKLNSLEESSTKIFRVGDDLVINGQKMWITNAFQVLFCTKSSMINKFSTRLTGCVFSQIPEKEIVSLSK